MIISADAISHSNKKITVYLMAITYVNGTYKAFWDLKLNGKNNFTNDEFTKIMNGFIFSCAKNVDLQTIKFN